MVTPIYSMREGQISFGGAPILNSVTLHVSVGDIICLIGRNGAGKSTLLKTIAGLVELDDGAIWRDPALSCAYLPQGPVYEEGSTVLQHVMNKGEVPAHDAENLISQLHIPADGDLDVMSGGEKRRADLARVLASGARLLLFDEPTNHLDLTTISWLENWLAQFQGAALLVSHDRTFLRNVTNRTYWLDRGTLRENPRGFTDFERWSQMIYDIEEKEQDRLSRTIGQETMWLRRGVTARRRRNRGRVRRLLELREKKLNYLRAVGNAALKLDTGNMSGKTVLEAFQISKGYGDHQLFENFSTMLQRGDRVGVIGPNGVGKTTLINILTGVAKADTGKVKLGSNLTVAYFDQSRAALDPAKTPVETIADAGGDHVWAQGSPKHVVAFLNDFLFTKSQINTPLRALSGGERNRLLLAKLFARQSNFVILDEPTNDLDMETLELLEDVLATYDGTALIVSHDRDFLDRVVTSTMVFEGDGTLIEYAGGYSDYLLQKDRPTKSEAPVKPVKSRASGNEQSKKPIRKKLSFKEQHELQSLPAQMDQEKANIQSFEARLGESDLFNRDAVEFIDLSNRLQRAQAALAEAEDRWLELELEREALERVQG